MNLLTVDASGRYLKNGSDPFYWVGDTGWHLTDITREEVDLYMADRRARGFTIIQGPIIIRTPQFTEMVITPSYTPNAYGDEAFAVVPVTTTGEATFNEAYLEHIDYIIDAAEANGLYICPTVVWGSTIDMVIPVASPTLAAWIGEQLGARYADREHVVWIAVGEYQKVAWNAVPGDDSSPSAGELALEESIATGLVTGLDGVAQLITMHPDGSVSSSQHWHGETWLDFHMTQSFEISGASQNDVANDYALTSPVTPVINGECGYEGRNQGRPLDPVTPYKLRYETYNQLLQGAFGITYGHWLVWQFVTGWEAALGAPGVADMMRLKALMQSRPLGQAPAQSIILNNGGAYTSLTKRRACLGDSAGYAFVYFPQSGLQNNIDTSGMSGITIDAYWYNPRDGQIYGHDGVQITAPAESFTKSGSKSFTSPGEGTENDWVLVLDDATKGYALPGGGTLVTVVSDTFTDTNGVNITAHAPDVDVVGDGWIDANYGTALSGDIQSNQLRFSADTCGCVIDTGLDAAGYVEVNATWVTGAAVDNRNSILMRWVDGSNLIFINFRVPQDDINIYQEIAGVQSPIIAATGIGFTAGSTYALRVVSVNGVISVQVDGVTVLSTSALVDVLMAGTHYGLVRNAGNNATRFDNFTVKTLEVDSLDGTPDIFPKASGYDGVVRTTGSITASAVALLVGSDTPSAVQIHAGHDSDDDDALAADSATATGAEPTTLDLSPLDEPMHDLHFAIGDTVVSFPDQIKLPSADHQYTAVDLDGGALPGESILHPSTATGDFLEASQVVLPSDVVINFTPTGGFSLENVVEGRQYFFKRQYDYSAAAWMQFDDEDSGEYVTQYINNTPPAEITPLTDVIWVKNVAITPILLDGVYFEDAEGDVLTISMNLPTGVSITQDSDGRNQITGTPTGVASETEVTGTVTDIAGDSISITPWNYTVLDSVAVPAGTVGTTTEATIVAAIEGAGLVASVEFQSNDTYDAGTLIGLSPASGTLVAVGSVVNVVISAGFGFVINLVPPIATNNTGSIWPDTAATFYFYPGYTPETLLEATKAGVVSGCISDETTSNSLGAWSIPVNDNATGEVMIRIPYTSPLIDGAGPEDDVVFWQTVTPE